MAELVVAETATTRQLLWTAAIIISNSDVIVIHWHINLWNWANNSEGRKAYFITSLSSFFTYINLERTQDGEKHIFKQADNQMIFKWPWDVQVNSKCSASEPLRMEENHRETGPDNNPSSCCKAAPLHQYGIPKTSTLKGDLWDWWRGGQTLIHNRQHRPPPPPHAGQIQEISPATCHHPVQ